MIDPHYGWLKSYKPLVIGYTLSLLLTLSAYLFVTRHHLRDGELIITLFTFAFIQSLLQFVFFLHLGIEKKPRWSMGFFLFTLFIVVIIIGGSMWIMSNLSYNLMNMGG